MENNRFKETKEFADAILSSWAEYVNHRGFKTLALASEQMVKNDLVISVRLAAGLNDRISLSLCNNRQHWELFAASPVDNTNKSLEYTIDFLLGYCKDVIRIGLKENES